MDIHSLVVATLGITVKGHFLLGIALGVITKQHVHDYMQF